MKAIRISSPGGPDVLAYSDVATPQPGVGELLIRVVASGVNFIDIFVREGRYNNPLPFTPGQEAAGIVVEVGEGVSDFNVGDRVAWCSVLGTYAEFALAPADRVVLIPHQLSFEQSAAVMLQGMTAHYLSHSCYPIQHCDHVLIQAGAGGTGLLLTQMAKSLGARVTTTVSTEDKARLSREAGADDVIGYKGQPWTTELKRITEHSSLAAVYDSVGAATFKESLNFLRPRGTAVLYGSASGEPAPFGLIELATLGSLFVTRPLLKHYTLTREQLLARATSVFELVASGALKLRIDHAYPLSDAAQAHRDLESRKTIGKLLLMPQSIGT